MIAYFNGRFLPREEIRISPDDRGFFFGDGVYEVARIYNGRIFRPDDHRQRLERSLRELRIAWPGAKDFAGICQRLLKENGLEGCGATMYLQVTRGAAPRQHAFPEAGTPPTVYGYVQPFEPTAERKQWETGVAVILAPDQRWARCDIKSLNLLANVLANQQAHECGVEETLLVRDGMVTEGSHTGFCAVYGGTLQTHPETGYILGSITRKVVLELCRDLGIPVREFPIQLNRLKEADELMILGTSTEVMPVVRVDDWQVAGGTPGPVTRKLQAAFRNLYAGW